MKIETCTKEQILTALEKSTNLKADAFAKTFVGKADKQEMWDKCKGVFDAEGNLLGMSIVTVSTREPKIMNMQLLHTFSDHRKKGVAALLVAQSLDDAVAQDVKYYRVSAEQSAAVFYAKCGIRFMGIQKSGTLLSFDLLSNIIDRKLKRVSQFEYVFDDVMVNKLFRANGKIDVDRTIDPKPKDAEVIAVLESMAAYDITHTVPF